MWTAWFLVDPVHDAGLAHVPILGLVIKTMKTVSAPKNLSTVHATVTVTQLVCLKSSQIPSLSANRTSR